MKNFTIKTTVFSLLFILLLFLSMGCSTASKTQKGARIGAGAGATVGALIGKTAGNTALGSIIGGAIGGTAGAYIGSKMDQMAKFNQVLLFDAGSADLSPDAQTSLKSLAANMKNSQDVTIAITGYTDSLGTAAYNMDLSVKRAEGVKTFLAAAGVSDKRMATQGKGATEQIADNTTHAGREKNRRVVITVVSGKK
jgi:outer membrane protein OmpA-like peptidoglycan-associated protein